ncbi:hypothetical protein RRG08_061528 [Elysia crispata]|uniref:Uncharacterized protein n=1 Tax=Elysia crispata TaxID=231223 RepID=A0AAE1APU5_9GAST|nr:hypothetical protein RRG08_061528 [Elysia crispata]
MGRLVLGLMGNAGTWEVQGAVGSARTRGWCKVMGTWVVLGLVMKFVTNIVYVPLSDHPRSCLSLPTMTTILEQWNTPCLNVNSTPTGDYNPL